MFRRLFKPLMASANNSFIVIEAENDKLSGSTGFSSVARYIFGKNSTSENITMTTHVFTQAFHPELSQVSIQIVLPFGKDIGSFLSPNQSEIRLREIIGGMAAVSKFRGNPTGDIAVEKEKALRSTLTRDGLKPKMGCLLAHYNNPTET